MSPTAKSAVVTPPTGKYKKVDHSSAIISAPASTTSTTPAKLTPAEEAFLRTQEARIINGFAEIAEALHAIRSYGGDGRLYATYKTFEDYVFDRFQFKKQHGHRLARSGEFIQRLKEAKVEVKDMPVTESQLRPIFALPAPDQVKFWQDVTKSTRPGKLTAKDVTDKVKDYAIIKKVKLRLPPPDVTPTPRSSPAESDKKEICEGLLERLLTLSQHFNNADAIKKQVFHIRALLMD